MKPQLIFLSAVLISISAIIVVNSTSCKKSCFDRELKRLHENDGCTADCPGVTGCDGNFYCNECEANRQGISVP